MEYFSLKRSHHVKTRIILQIKSNICLPSLRWVDPVRIRKIKRNKPDEKEDSQMCPLCPRSAGLKGQIPHLKKRNTKGYKKFLARLP